MSTLPSIASPQQQPPASPLSTLAGSSSITSPAPEGKTNNNLRPKLRLPPTIEPILVPYAQSTRLLFSQAIADDQRAALQPDYRTSFQSANDVVKRLLPYHVWHVNEQDLLWTLDKSDGKGEGTSYGGVEKRKRRNQQEADYFYPTEEETYNIFARYAKLHAKAKRLRYQMTGGASISEGAPFSKESLYNIEKLAVEQERELLAAEQENLRQAKEKAIEAGVRWEDLLRLGPAIVNPGASTSVQGSGKVETEARTNVTNSPNGTTTASNGFSPISFQKSVGSIQNGTMGSSSRQSIGTTSTNPVSGGIVDFPATPKNPSSSNAGKGSKPRGRPRKTRDEDGKIIATPPSAKPTINQAKVSTPTPAPVSKPSTSTIRNGPTLPAASVSTPIATRPAPAHAAPAAPPPLLPPPPSSKPTPSPSPASVIPSHPIPLVLPLSTLGQLSALGIAPVPAPHLLPAINAQQAQAQRQGSNQGSQPAIALSQSVHSTAPRPAPQNQVEPALLMGITEAPLPRNTGVVNQGRPSGSTQQMLHVSVVLSKLSPSQLSGLAALMQSLQNNGGGGGNSKTNTSSEASGPGNNNAPNSSSRSLPPSNVPAATTPK